MTYDDLDVDNTSIINDLSENFAIDLKCFKLKQNYEEGVQAVADADTAAAVAQPDPDPTGADDDTKYGPGSKEDRRKKEHVT